MPENDHIWEALNGNEVFPEEWMRQVIQDKKQEALLDERERVKWQHIEGYWRERDAIINYLSDELKKVTSYYFIKIIIYSPKQDIFMVKICPAFGYGNLYLERDKCLEYFKSKTISVIHTLEKTENHQRVAFIFFKIRTILPDLYKKYLDTE